MVFAIGAFGFGMYTDFGKPSLNFFAFGMHLHPRNDTNPCPFRFGLELALFGVHLDVGLFR